MRDKITRNIEFYKDDIPRLQEFASQRNQLFEEFVSDMIHQKLIPLLEHHYNEHLSGSIGEQVLHGLSYTSLSKTKFSPRLHDTFTTQCGHGQHIHGHTRNLFPSFLATRNLLRLLTENASETIPYKEFVRNTLDVAQKLKAHLIQDEKFAGEFGLYERGLTDGLPWIALEEMLPKERRGFSRSTKTTTEQRINWAKNWFTQYHLNARPHSKKLGILLQLDLVHTEFNGGELQITLTQRGFDLALIGPNPLLDIHTSPLKLNELTHPLSADEKRAYFEAIMDCNHEEFQRVKQILEFIKEHETQEDGVSRSAISNAIQEGYIENFSDSDNRNYIENELSGMLSRLWDMDLVTDFKTKKTGVQSGRIRKYVVNN